MASARQIDFGFRVARIARRLRQAVDADLRVLANVTAAELEACQRVLSNIERALEERLELPATAAD